MIDFANISERRPILTRSGRDQKKSFALIVLGLVTAMAVNRSSSNPYRCPSSKRVEASYHATWSALSTKVYRPKELFKTALMYHGFGTVMAKRPPGLSIAAQFFINVP